MQRKIITIIAFLCVAVLSFSGCIISPPDEELPVVQDEYFKYSIKTYKDGKQEAYLYGFTELGAEQTHLVLSPDINGVPVVGFGYRIKLNYGNLWNNYKEICEFKSEILERLYIPFSAEQNGWLDGSEHSQGDLSKCYFVFWNDLKMWADSSRKIIISYNLLSNYVNNNNTAGYSKCLLANLSYMYNYDNAENDGYYWADCDTDLIKFIPPEPTRKGYTFDGWYKEPECLNIWNFETDKVETDIVELSKYDNLDKYNPEQITFLYAKWIKY